MSIPNHWNYQTNLEEGQDLHKSNQIGILCVNKRFEQEHFQGCVYSTRPCLVRIGRPIDNM